MESLRLYYELNELIKNYQIFKEFDKPLASQLLIKINELRLAIAILAEQHQIFWEQLNIEGNSSGYTNDLSYSPDDINAIVTRFIANLNVNVTMSLVLQGDRETVFTRQSVSWQQLASNVQTKTAGQQIPFDLPQEIFLRRNESLNIGITNQTTNGQFFVHGSNIKDDYSPNKNALATEINSRDVKGDANLPQTQLIPIEFKFTAATNDNKAVSLNGDSDIFSIKSEKSVILTHVSTTSINSRISLRDNGRNQTLCTEVESQGVAGFVTNPYAVWYPLPHFHLLRAKDRFALKALNGSAITNAQDTANTIQRITFRGFTI